MARKVRPISLLYVVISILFFTDLYRRRLLRPSTNVVFFSTATSSPANFVIRENITRAELVPPPIPISPTAPPPSTTAVLLPDWEVLVIISPETSPSNLDGYSCLFDTGEISRARFSGVLPFPDRKAFSCLVPSRIRRKCLPMQPMLVKNPERESSPTKMPPLLRWTYLVYDSLTTEDDVVLFVKGVNNRQGSNRPPTDFRCVFGDPAKSTITTAVTSSAQEVFRCERPEFIEESVKVSLQIVAENRVVPSLAYYTRPRTLAPDSTKSFLCAATMVYNVTKFLREWVMYHSKIGVEKFLLYDNGSEDDLQAAVNEVAGEGFDVAVYPWRWPKTQESGFSHSVLYAINACTWMMYLDIDEFVYSPAWKNRSKPSKSLLHNAVSSNSIQSTGQVSINCHEFGPSNQGAHPSAGVTQGYNCRRKLDNRHKSIVQLQAVDYSLLNVIHHFKLKPGYETRKASTRAMVVNHYKYQAWPEFKAKFRRRVSAYVLDWKDKANPNSKDRTPGLGFEPVEPQGWAQRFCEVRDNNMKELVRRWFGVELESGNPRMPWEDDGKEHYELGFERG